MFCLCVQMLDLAWKLVECVDVRLPPCMQELYNKGLMPLSRAALDSIRKQKTFMQVCKARAAVRSVM